MPILHFTVYRPPGHDMTTLVPATQFDLAPLRAQKWQHGDLVVSEFKKPRNGRHHRLVFQLLKFVFDNQERFEHPEALRRHLTLQTSFVLETIDRATGEILRIPRSWSYTEMDEAEFQQLHSEVVSVVLREFWPTEDENWLRAGVQAQAFMDGVMSFE